MEPLQNPNPNPTQLWANILKTNHTSASPNPHQREPAGPSATATSGRVVVGSCKSASGIAVAVVDANAIIQGGERLARSADKFVTVSEVIDEIRDPASRHSLHFLPFTVDTVEPSPESLNKVIQFARATGDLHTLSDVDLKLIALTYTLEAQIHGTNNLRHSPPPINMVNVKRLPEKDLPGWGSNVANLEEWEALDHVDDHGPDPNSKILPLEELNLNVISTGQHSTEGASTVTEGEPHAWSQEKGGSSFGRPRRYSPKKREVNVEGKKMVADGIDASQGEYGDNADDWQPAVSRSTHRRYLRRKAKREMYAASSKNDGEHAAENVEAKNFGETKCGDMLHECCEETLLQSENFEESSITEGQSSEDISTILEHLRLEEDSLNSLHNKEVNLSSGVLEELGEFSNDDDGCLAGKGDECDLTDQELEHLETSQNSESVCASQMDDDSSEHGWTVRSLSESTVACVTSDYAMQNVLLQMGLRLLAPGGMQIRELHRWILKCHACYKVTTEIGKIFCPSCGNGGTLRKVAVTVGENGIVLAAHRPRISLRGTKFSLPLPQGGREAITKNPILREDQLPEKFLYPKTKKKNKQGEDIFVSNDIFLHHTDKRAPLQPPVRKALAVFSGKRNPNDNRFSRSKH